MYACVCMRVSVCVAYVVYSIDNKAEYFLSAVHVSDESHMMARMYGCMLVMEYDYRCVIIKRTVLPTYIRLSYFMLNCYTRWNVNSPFHKLE